METAAALRMHPDVVVVERPDGTSWLLHMSANTLRLDGDSTQLLKSILDRGPEDSAREIAQRFGVDEEEVRRDVSDFVNDLRKQRVLVTSAAPQNSGGMPARMIDKALALADRPSRHMRRRAWALLLVARIAVALFGWAATIRAWERRYPQPAEPRHDHDALDLIDFVVRDTAARSLLHHECKERGLACLAMARRAGVAADLLIGLTYSPLAAHVWVECGGRIISDVPEHCTPYEKVMRYG
jgi:Transglutaminase-like superfamily/Coenzyme PQQ synthesis protein D (PqqD)